MERALRSGRRRVPFAGLAVLLLAAGPVWAQQDDLLTKESYLTPPHELAEAVLAPRHEDVRLTDLGPDGRWFLHTLRDGLPRIEDFARPHLNLGGVQIDPAANRARMLTTRSAVGFELISWQDGRSVHIEVPRGARVSAPSWAPDGARIAFFAHTDDATHIYVAEVATGRSRRVTASPVLATLVTSLAWTNDGKIVTVLVPEGRGAPPAAPAVPTTPRVRITAEGENKLRTYVSLLADPHEQALLEYYITGQLAVIDPDSRRVETVGRPAMIRAVSPSPDGRFFRVTTIREPFSYVVPVSSFATVEEVWDASGQILATLVERPMNEGIQGANRNDDAKRAIVWRPDGAGLGFLEREPAPSRAGAADDDADANAAHADATDADAGEDRPGRGARKDRVMQWLPPFDSTSLRVVHESENTIGSVEYSADGRFLFVTETVRGTRHLYAVDLNEPDERYTLVQHRTQDFHGNPGTLMTRTDPLGLRAARLSSDGNAVYLSGTVYSKNPLEEAPRPFIDRVEIRSGETERLFESAADVYEQVLAVLDDDLERVVVSRESSTMVPNSYLFARGSGELRQLTHNRDHTPDITAARREIIEITRVDGLKFWARVTLPADYTEGTRLPALFWFYPSEYTNQEAYDRSNRTYNKNRFPTLGPRSMEILVRAGYAVVQPDAPIVGPEGRMNDNYVPDLRNNLAAVIDTLDRRGYIDRDRLGLGGHSYGAFSTVNAMVHTPFFKAGIAGNGNYNRTLTPIGFQRERREFWEARERYIEMSPFMWAERLNGALFMYHGTEDQNVGTHPINSERLFHALNGLGKTAALYMYPYEDHGPATRETLLDLWARWTEWLDRYVKNAGQAAASAEVAAAGGR